MRRMSAALALVAVAATGCSGQSDAQKTIDDAQRLVSNAKTCGDLVKLSASKLDDVQNNMNDPAALRRTLQQATDELKAKAATVDDARLKKAINAEVVELDRVANRAEQGQSIDVGAVRRANARLAAACT